MLVFSGRCKNSIDAFLGPLAYWQHHVTSYPELWGQALHMCFQTLVWVARLKNHNTKKNNLGKHNNFRNLLFHMPPAMFQ
jgi:hypothetical protein